MGIYRVNEYDSIEESFLPSTNMASFINKGDPDGWFLSWALGGSVPFFTGIALAVEVSLWFLLLPIVCIAFSVLLLVGACSRYKMKGVTYSYNVLPVEQAYAKLAPKRKRQYKTLVKESYRNAVEGKSNRKIIELLETYAHLDYKDDERLSKFVDDELEIARKVAKEMKEMERQLEST